MSRHWSVRLLAVVLLLAWVPGAFAQSQATTGVIEGTVADDNGGVLPGATADQEEWIRRKSASVLRFERSTALLSEQFTDFDPLQRGWLAPEDYTLADGSFPIRVRGAGVIAAITVSGLASDEDHQLVVEGIRNYLKTVGA